MLCPSRLTLPATMARPRDQPARALTSVDLPAPFAPTSPTIFPGGTLTFTPDSATLPSYRTVRFSHRSTPVIRHAPDRLRVLSGRPEFPSACRWPASHLDQSSQCDRRST